MKLINIYIAVNEFVVTHFVLEVKSVVYVMLETIFTSNISYRFVTSINRTKKLLTNIGHRTIQ